VVKKRVPEQGTRFFSLKYKKSKILLTNITYTNWYK